MANPNKATTPAYQALVDDLMIRYPDLEQGSLFGMPCVKTAGKAVLGSFNGGVVFKLEDPAVFADAIALDGSELFDPSGKARPMKQWVVVPALHDARWEHFASAAITNARG